MYSYSMELNSAQRQAAEAGDGPIAIIAGPGTGKTKTLVARIEWLVAQGVQPGSILALTFTKKAAQEMSERLAYDAKRKSGVADAGAFLPGARRPEEKTQYLTGPQSKPYISTFHALCFDLLNEKLEKPPQFIAEPARLALIKNLPKPAAFKGLSSRELSLIISRGKNMADDAPEVARLVGAYNAELKTQNLHDFDDLLLQTHDMLQNDPIWRAYVQKRFSHILVDEFQDTNNLQYQLLQLLRQTDNLFVIGDPQQSIYGFRGADGDIFARFARDFPQAKTIVLHTNYRSASQVVALANAIYPQAPALTAYNKTPGDVRATKVLNEYREADFVLQQIQQAIGGSDLQRAVSDDDRANQRTLADFAILYRSRLAARVLQQRLAGSGLPFQVVGEGSPYDKPSVQALVQLITQVAYPKKPGVVKGFSPTQIAKLLGPINPAQKPHDIAAALVTAFALPLDADLRQMLGMLVRFTTAKQAADYFADIATQNFYDPRADAITLLTIHASKGLEFAHVFLIGAEEGILPSARGTEPEEKRLFYVAATRAKQQLSITAAAFRHNQKTQPSRFIAEARLPLHADNTFAKDQKLAQKRQAKRAQTSLF